MLSAWIFYARIRSVCKFSYLRSAFSCFFSFFLISWFSFLICSRLLCVGFLFFAYRSALHIHAYKFDWVYLSVWQCVDNTRIQYDTKRKLSYPWTMPKWLTTTTARSKSMKIYRLLIVLCIEISLFARSRADRNLSTLYRKEMCDGSNVNIFAYPKRYTPHFLE